MLFENLLKKMTFPFKMPREEDMRPDDVVVESDVIPVPEQDLDERVHQWQLIARSYAPPVQHIPEHLTDIALVARAMFGVTTILLQDEFSGEIRKEEILGSDENQLAVILDKAERYGMQYIPFNGKSFAVALVPPETNSTE